MAPSSQQRERRDAALVVVAVAAGNAVGLCAGWTWKAGLLLGLFLMCCAAVWIEGRDGW